MKIYRPREELRPYVRYYWVLKNDEPFSILTFPIGCPQIIFHKNKSMANKRNLGENMIRLIKNLHHE